MFAFTSRSLLESFAFRRSWKPLSSVAFVLLIVPSGYES